MTKLLLLADVVLAPFVLVASFLLWCIRRAGVQRMPVARAIFHKVGVFPIRKHYHEPLFDTRTLKVSPAAERNLPGVDFRESLQLDFLKSLDYRNELLRFPLEKTPGEIPAFYYRNEAFGPGDASMLFNVIRKFKPATVIEIGSGNSTLMARNAIIKNGEENAAYACRHICIEPYEAPWLSRAGVELRRSVVETVPLELFASLEANDLLFIDSSHVIRPQGDVLYEMLEILPSLKKGVIVHFHDIFSPRDYLDEWLRNRVYFWNEQYLLEAFLSFNRDFEILAAVNWLKHRHYDLLASRCAHLEKEHEPGSFYLKRR